MTWLSAVAALVVAIHTWIASLTLATLLVSQSRLLTRLRQNGKERRAEWFAEHGSDARIALWLVRSACPVLLFSLLLLEFAAGADAPNAWNFVAAGLSTIALVWVFPVVVASAIARYATEAVLASGMGMIVVVATVLRPLLRAIAVVDEAVKRLTGANLREREEEAEAELLRSIEDTHREGGLDERAAALLENIVDFGSTDVGEVMTPRTDIDGIECTDDLAEIRSAITRFGHSRIPVYEGDLDHIVGVLYVKDLIPYLGEDASGFQLRPVLRQPNVVPETKSVGELLADFQRSEVHLAIVIDEYGGTAGLATIEDVLEEIVGEIQDEHDADDEDPPALRAINEVRAEVDGRFRIDDLNEALELELPEDEEFDTVAGFVLATLGRVPDVGESFESHNARFTTKESSPTHIALLEVEVLPQDA